MRKGYLGGGGGGERDIWLDNKIKGTDGTTDPKRQIHKYKETKRD